MKRPPVENKPLDPNELSFSGAPRPDLEEFLTALDGFLVKQTAPSNPGHLRFLEIFFRSVKAHKGHLLKLNDQGGLRSVMSFGIGDNFDETFNKAQEKNESEPSPLNMSCTQKEPIAIVDLSRDPDIPPWFSTLMKTYRFSSLVAVPLMGTEKPVGILCAYYDDVCLFDRATLSHLMMIGRMVGGATEKSMVADKAEIHGKKELVADKFLTFLCAQTFNNLQMYELMSRLVKEAIQADGFICGPVRLAKNVFTLTVAAGFGVSDNVISKHVPLPTFVGAHLLSGHEKGEIVANADTDWGKLEDLIEDENAIALCRPISFRNKIEGAILAWKTGDQKFDDDDDVLLTRLASVASLASHVS